MACKYKYKDNWYSEEEVLNLLRKENTSFTTLYNNLLKELETSETGRKVFEQVKKDYKYKSPHQLKLNDHWYSQDEVYGLEDKPSAEEIAIRKEKAKYTLEEQQEEAIVTLLGLYAADKIDKIKDKKLWEYLRDLWNSISDFVRQLLRQDDIKIDSLPITITINDLANIMAYGNSKIILPGYKIEYRTPLDNKYDTLEEVNNEIRNLVDSDVEVDLSETTIPIGKDLKNIEDIPVNDFVGVNGTVYEKHEDGWKLPRYDVEKNYRYYIEVDDYTVLFEYNRKNARFDGNEFRKEGMDGFIEKNEEYEIAKEIIETWLEENDIVYDPEEVYSRGQGFYSSINAYSNLELDLLFQNLLQHIEDHKKIGSEFVVSAYTKPINSRLNSLEREGSNVRFVIFPQSQDIKWAAPTDVHSGSVWDAHERTHEYKKSEILGISYTKAPELDNIDQISPNLADIIDNLSYHYNELGIELTPTNFRIEYDSDINYSTKKLIDSINKILDDKYGKIVKPKIVETNGQVKIALKSKLDNSIISIHETENDARMAWRNLGENTLKTKMVYLKVYPGKQPTKTKDNVGSIEDVMEKINQKKEHTNQALINLKIAELKEIARKYPRSLITSKVVPIEPYFVNNSERQYSKRGIEDTSLYPKPITEQSKRNINVLLDNQNEFIKELGVDQTIQLVNYVYNKVVSALESGETYNDTVFSIKAGLVFNRDRGLQLLQSPNFNETQKLKIQEGIDRYNHAIDNWGKIETLVNHELNKTKGLEEEALDDEVKGEVWGKESWEIDPKSKVSAKIKIILSGVRKPDNKAIDKAKARFIQDKMAEGLSEEYAKGLVENMSDSDLFKMLPEKDRYITTWFGQQELIDFNQAYKNLLPLLAGEREDIELIIRKLEKESNNELWLIEVIDKLKKLDKQTSNQIASEMPKHELDMRYVQINNKRVKVAGKTVEYYNTFVRRSNQNEISQLVHEAWENNFVDSDILIPVEGNDYKFNRKAVDDLKEKYDSLVTDTGTVYRQITGFVINSVADYNRYKDSSLFKAQLEKNGVDGVKSIVKIKGVSFVVTENGLVPKPSAVLDINTIIDIYNSVGITLSEKTAKTLAYKKASEALQPIQYILEQAYDNIDGKYYEDNLQPINQDAIKKLAKLESRYSPLRAFSPDNFRTQGKQVYAYTMKNFLTERAKELKNNPTLISQLRGTAYHGDSVHLQYLDVNSELYNTVEGKKFRDNFDTIEDLDLQVIKDLQATVKWGDQRFTRVDEITQELAVLGLFVNSNTKGDNRIARFVMPTFSDKTRSAIVPLITTKVDYDVVGKTISDDVVDELYTRIVLPEIKRIAHWVTLTELGLNHKQYKDGGMFFYSLPELNELKVDGQNLFNIIKNQVKDLSDDFENIRNFGFTNPNVEQTIKEYVKNYVNNSINEKLAKWDSYEMISEDEIQFDLNYLKTLLGTSSDILTPEQVNTGLQLLAADFKVNDMIAKAEMHYLFIGDPAMMYKGGSESNSVIKAIEANEDIFTWPVIEETYTNIGKRLALEIATGKKMANNHDEVYIQLMLKDPVATSDTMEYLSSILDNKVFDRKHYITLDKNGKKAYKKQFANSGGFLEIDGADAQEFTTMGEWLHNLIQFGLSPLTEKEVKELLEIENKVNPSSAEIQRLKDTIISVSKQPQKPVYSGQIFDDALNAMNIVYVKSSAFPLSKHLTKDFQLDNLRIVMEELEKNQGKFVRASFESANKLGSVEEPLEVFDEDGSVKPVEEMLNRVIAREFKDSSGQVMATQEDLNKLRLATAPYRELERSNFRIQQETPVKEKGYIKRGTQETKLLWLNILGEPGMAELYSEYLENYEEIYKEGKVKLFEELGLDLDKPLEEQKININSLSKLLKKEARERNYPLQDIRGLDVVGNNFIMPLMFHASSNRYEALLNSIINNRILAITMPGNGYILGTAEGFKVKEVSNYPIPGGTIFTSAWTGELTNAHFIDNATGKHITKKISEYAPENITFVPAKVLAPSKFVVDGKMINMSEYVIEKDGRSYLDETKIDKEILKLFGFRIPTSGQMSMASIEIAGFLPESYGDLIIAPRDFTKQMGSDFDVDKLMTYHYELEQVDGKWVKKDSKKNRIIEIHHEVLSAKSDKIQEQIMKPLSFDVAKEQAKLIQKQAKRQWSMLDDEYQKMKRIGGAFGKDGTGWYSLGVTFHASLQMLPNKVQVLESVDDKMVPYNLTIAGLTSDGKLGNEKTLGDVKRYISEVHIQRQNYSVDNEKEQLMFPLNDNGYTFHFTTFLDELGFDLVKVNSTDGVVEISLVDFLRTQPVIKEYVNLRNLDKSDIEVVETLTKKYGESNWKTIVGKPEFAQQLFDGNANQSAVLALFLEAKDYGGSMAKIMTAFNTDSSGLGKSIFDNIDKLEKVAELEGGKRFGGISQFRKHTINGLATTYGLDSTRALNTIFPYDKFSSIFGRISEAIGDDLTVEDKQEIVREFRKFIFASHILQQLEEDYDIESLRKELFFFTEDKEPLAKYVKDLKKQKLLSSSLFTLMSEEVHNTDLPSTIKWNNSIREDNENKYYFDWLSMFLNETSLPPYNGREMTYQSLAQLLVSYAYLEGGIQEATQFIKHVPIEYLKGVGFDKVLRNINFNDPDTFGYKDGFLRQYLQHNPMKVKHKYTPDKLYEVIEGDSKNINKLTSFTLKEEFQPEFVRVYNNKTDIQNRKLRKKGAVLLFMKMDDGKYYKIPVLGLHGMNEYNFNKGGAIKSLIDSYNKNTVYDTAYPNITPSAIVSKQADFGFNKPNPELSDLLSGVTASHNAYNRNLAKFYLSNLDNLDVTFVLASKKDGDKIPGRGWYDNVTGELGINKDEMIKLLKEGDVAEVEKVILHELTHAFINKYLITDDIPDVLKPHVAKLKRLFEIVKRQYPNREAFVKEFEETGKITKEQLEDIYGSFNIKEFAALVMTRTKFQEKMYKIKSGETTLGDRIKTAFSELIRELLHFAGFNKDSVTTEAIAAIVELVGYKPEIKQTDNPQVDNVQEEILEDGVHKYKYYGAMYDIIVKDGVGVSVVGYTGKAWKKEKLLEHFNSNPNVDPQNEKYGYNISETTMQQETVGEITLSSQQQDAYDRIVEFIEKSGHDAPATFTLAGYAGTGKTTLTKFIIKYLDTKNKKYALSSPTHRAKEVLMDATGKYAMTLAKTLGLQPGIELDDFNLVNKIFNQKLPDRVPQNGILIVDEASMINDDLYEFILEVAKLKNTKVLFVGDDAQLKPVKQKTKAKPFRETTNIFKLTQIMRTANDNPMPSAVLQPIRDNLKSKVDVFEHKTNLNAKGEGIVFTKNKLQFMESIAAAFTSDNFKKNLFYVRALAYTNDRVAELNQFIRNKLYGYNPENFYEGELVMMYENRFFENLDWQLPNGMDLKVSNVKKGTANINGELIEGEFLALNSAKKGDYRKTIFFSDNPTSNYLKTLNTLKNKALATKNKADWVNFYQLDESLFVKDNIYMYKEVVYLGLKELKEVVKKDFPQMSTSQINTFIERLKMKDKTFDYGYAHTIHKSQGGTYEQSFVDEDNIDIIRGFSNPDYEMLNQIKYVGFSRSSIRTTSLSSYAQESTTLQVDNVQKTAPLENLQIGEVLHIIFTINDKTVTSKVEIVDYFNQGKNLDYGGREDIFEIKLKNVNNGKIYVVETTLSGEVKSQYFDGKTIYNPNTKLVRNLNVPNNVQKTVQNLPSSDFQIKNLFTVEPIQAADKKAKAKAKIATQYIGFAEGIPGSSTALYAKQISEQNNKFKIPISKTLNKFLEPFFNSNDESIVEPLAKNLTNEDKQILAKSIGRSYKDINQFDWYEAIWSDVGQEEVYYYLKTGNNLEQDVQKEKVNSKLYNEWQNFIKENKDFVDGFYKLPKEIQKEQKKDFDKLKEKNDWYVIELSNLEYGIRENLLKQEGYLENKINITSNIVNSGNYSSTDVIFVSIGGKRGNEAIRKAQQDRTIREAIKALEAGATLITDNAAYTEQSTYNEGEKRLAANLKHKGYIYSETIVDGHTIGVWNKKMSNEDNIIEASLMPITVQGLPEITIDLQKPSKCL